MAKTLVLNGTNFAENKLATVTWGESIPCTGIVISESAKSVTSMDAFTLTATPEPANTTDSVVWSSSDSSVATVASGVVTPASLGTATITVTCGSFSATCAVTIDNVVVPYVAVAGYAPYKRSGSQPALTTDKKSTETSAYMIIAANMAEGLYPIETKDNIDTSPYRFVPIIIPNGATKAIITSNLAQGKIKTRSLWIDSHRSSASTSYPNDGAYCVQGLTDGFDQGSSTQTPLTLNIPSNVEGLDALCIAVVIADSTSQSGVWYGDCGTDYAENVTLAFSYDE